MTNKLTLTHATRTTTLKPDETIGLACCRCGCIVELSGDEMEEYEMASRVVLCPDCPPRHENMKRS